MKRCIKAVEAGNTLSLELQLRGLLGHVQKYCLMAQRYDPLSSGEVYEKYFSVHGDYLAYFAMAVHGTPTYDKILDYIGRSQNEIEEWFREVPTVEAMAEYAARNWYGDGDDLIIYLDNCSTGTCLYSMDDVEGFLEDYQESGGRIVTGSAITGSEDTEMKTYRVIYVNYDDRTGETVVKAHSPAEARKLTKTRLGTFCRRITEVFEVEEY